MRRCLPARIDALLPQEMALCFEYELWQMLARQAVGWASARRALRRCVSCLVEALEAFEARLQARERLAVGEATERLGDRQRRELRERFGSELAEVLRTALPAAARLVSEQLEHERHLRCVEEAGVEALRLFSVHVSMVFGCFWLI